MSWLANALVVLVAGLHLYFLVLEMFLWTRPLGLRTFRLSADFAQQSKSLAANQGLYNGFLCAGLVWGLIQGRASGEPIVLFFLSCVIAAGVFGAVTVNRRILYIQAAPAALAMALIMLG